MRPAALIALALLSGPALAAGAASTEEGAAKGEQRDHTKAELEAAAPPPMPEMPTFAITAPSTRHPFPDDIMNRMRAAILEKREAAEEDGTDESSETAKAEPANDGAH